MNTHNVISVVVHYYTCEDTGEEVCDSVISVVVHYCACEDTGEEVCDSLTKLSCYLHGSVHSLIRGIWEGGGGLW